MHKPMLQDTLKSKDARFLHIVYADIVSTITGISIAKLEIYFKNNSV